jgi:hypothetical protein
MISRRQFGIGVAAMAVAGDGLRRPLNAPAAGLVDTGVQPGTTSAIVLARFVIVYGPGSGVFEYNPAPGAGTLVESFTQATTDPYGNKTIPGQTSYNDAAGQAFNISAGTGGYYTGHLATGWAAAPGATFTLGAGFGTGFGGPNALSIAAVQSDAGIFTEIAGTPAGGAAIARIVGKDPTALFGSDTAETWHTITLDAGWSLNASYAAPSYRLNAEFNQLQLTGLADFGAGTAANHNLNNANPLPVPYRPASVKVFRSQDLNTLRGGVMISPSGVIEFLSSSATLRYCEIDAVLPLNL